MRLKRTIRFTLISCFMLLSFTTLTIVAVMAYLNGKHALTEHIGAQLEEAAFQALDKIDRLLFFAKEDLEAWAAAQVMQDVFADDPDGRITDTLMRFKRDYGIYAAIVCVNPQGRVVAASELHAVGQDVSQEPWFQEAANASDTSIGDLAYDRLIGGVAVPITTPIVDAHDDTQVIGFLSSRFNWSELYDILTGIQVNQAGQSEFGYAALINREGFLRVGPSFMLEEGEGEGEGEELSRRNFLTLGYRSAEAALKGQKGFVIEEDPVGDTWLIGYAGSQGHRDFAGLGWAILVMQNTDEAFAPITQLGRQFVCIGFVVGLFVLFLAVVISNQISAPIRRLMEATKIIATGDLTHTIHVRSRDELGELAGAFNRMTIDLSTSRDTLLVMTKELEQSLVLKDELIAKVSHELRTPLTSIKEGVSLMRERKLGDVTLEQQDFLATIDQDLERLAGLINHLLDVSKLEAGWLRLQRARVDVRPLIEAVVRQYHPIQGNRTIVAKDAEVPCVFVDADRVRQVLGNLLSNAIKATNDHGTIVFRTDQRGAHVVVSVEDNGTGIAQEDLPKLFQKFSQVGVRDPAKPRGTGLGLVICKELVGLHQGRIEVASELGQGTTFSAAFPIYTDAFALAASFEELQNLLSRMKDKTIGLVAIHVDARFTSSETGGGPRETLERLAHGMRQQVKQEDILLAIEPSWIVLLALTDAEGMRVVVERLRGIVPTLMAQMPGAPSVPVDIGSALYPDDGSDAKSLFARATSHIGTLS